MSPCFQKALLLLVLFLGILPLNAQPTVVLNTELPGGAVSPGSYGYSVDIWNNLAIVGNSQSSTGGVFPFSRDEDGHWIPEGELIPPVTADLTHTFFGREVAIGDQVALVSDPNAFSSDFGDFAGAVFVYRRVPLPTPGQFVWLFEQRLFPSTILNEQRFGRSLAVWGDRAMVGTHGAAVHVFERDEGGPSQWGEVQRLTFDTSLSFGAEVALRGTVALVGAPFDALNGQSQAGRAFIFELDTGVDQWFWEKTLKNKIPTAGENFGISLDLASWTATGGPFPISTRRAIIGSHGTVYSWQKTTLSPDWVVQSLLADLGANNFGSIVAGSETEMHVRGFHPQGDPFVDTYVKSGGGWEKVRTYLPSTGCCTFANDLAADKGSVVFGDIDEETAFVYDPVIFADGFESGDVSRWSASSL